MRISLAVLFLVASACASSDGIIDHSSTQCGGDLVMEAGLHSSNPGIGATDDLTVTVLVSNESPKDMLVKSIRITPLPGDDSAYRLHSGYRAFKETVPAGEEKQFEIPVSGERLRPDDFHRVGVSFDVSVLLEDGDAYRCPFSAGVE
jgi:hypothetical protein